jgi:phenylacetate-coenzyme A ligase PaaK-like adenylate-forming protein
MNQHSLRRTIFSVTGADHFREIAIGLFRYQYRYNKLYRVYVDSLGYNVPDINEIVQIPFLPVSLFKRHTVVCGKPGNFTLFESSGTTDSGNSRHLVKDIRLYQDSFSRCFELFYGKPDQYAFFALLPSYLEREHSSLVYMMDKLIQLSGNDSGGFFLYDHDNLIRRMNLAVNKGKVLFLLGVTFSLLDLAEKKPELPAGAIVVETGGMKGRRREMTRQELHATLTTAFGIGKIHSEYGMTELLSQAWSKGDGIYNTPPWMKILIRDSNDPFSFLPDGKTGGINIIDFANMESCSFLSTQDLGRINDDGSFEVLGRFDYSDIRGCSLMID